MAMQTADQQMIFHMTPESLWESQRDLPLFTPRSLAEEGFIHCTAEPEKLQQVANAFYRDQPGPFIIVCIAPERLESELRWEMAHDHLFPHIYGPLNRSSVVRTLPFPRLSEREFALPQELKVQPV